MIRLTRVRTAQAIPAGFRGAKRVKRNQELIAGFQAGGPQLNEGVWKPAKTQLKKETGGKCAYCEAPVKAVAHGDVEHFRPKSNYWWLAYCYENYTYACQVCNQTNKGDKFPVAAAAMQAPALADPARLNPDPLNPGEGMTYADFDQACAAEQAHLPDVYREDPEAYFKWDVDTALKTVTLRARSGAVRHQRAAAGAEATLGLNRPDLAGQRFGVYEGLEIEKDMLARLPAGDPLAVRIRAHIKEMMADNGEFAGMVRYFVRDKWELAL